MKKLLVVVDYQNDFVSGSLGFSGAEKLESGLVTAIDSTLRTGGYVLFTRDTHENNYLQTREGTHLPVEHCIKGTTGHQLYGKLHNYETFPRPHTMIIDKPTFGYADIGECAIELCDGAPDSIEVCGLVTDICVISNAILLHSFFPMAQVTVLEKLSGTGNVENGAKAFDILRGMGIQVAG